MKVKWCEIKSGCRIRALKGSGCEVQDTGSRLVVRGASLIQIQEILDDKDQISNEWLFKLLTLSKLVVTKCSMLSYSTWREKQVLWQVSSRSINSWWISCTSSIEETCRQESKGQKWGKYRE